MTGNHLNRLEGGEIDALVFDVQGTLLDFFTPVSRALGSMLGDAGVEADLAALTVHWRRTYSEGMTAVVEGRAPYRPTASIYRDGLDQVLERAGVGAAIGAEARDRATGVWTALEPWGDTVEGLRRLRRRFRLVALTNGGMAGTIAMTARHDLGFHALLTSDLVETFKPDPRMYRLAIDALGLPPQRIAMVASHPYDLDAAHEHGMRAIFVERPLEFGPTTPNEATAPASASLAVPDCLALAARLGADRVAKD